MDGYQTMNEIQHKYIKALKPKICVMTANIMKLNNNNYHYDFYIEKPININKLKDILNNF